MDKFGRMSKYAVQTIETPVQLDNLKNIHPTTYGNRPVKHHQYDPLSEHSSMNRQMGSKVDPV